MSVKSVKRILCKTYLNANKLFLTQEHLRFNIHRQFALKHTAKMYSINKAEKVRVKLLTVGEGDSILK